MLFKTFVLESINTIEKTSVKLDQKTQDELNKFRLDPEDTFQTKMENDPAMLLLAHAFLLLKYPKISALFDYLLALVKGKDNTLQIIKNKLKKERNL